MNFKHASNRSPTGSGLGLGFGEHGLQTGRIKVVVASLVHGSLQTNHSCLCLRNTGPDCLEVNQIARILADCQAEIRRHEFQANYDRRSIQKLSETIESQ